jgi:lipopolysaccharide transport system ATP-binding protein
MKETIIVDHLWKKFRRFSKFRPRTLKDMLIQGFRELKPTETFWALRDVSFSVGPGEMVGIIGKNGAGKSTLLRLVGGVGLPNEGNITVEKPVRGLLELGAGFSPDLNGRENAYVAGVIDGLTRRQVSERMDSIIDFAELGAYIDQPLRTYSTGMRLRLAFAVAVHTEPRVLLIDEVLAVGDAAFRTKCIDRISRFRDDGCTILFVSHDEEQVRQFCDRLLWLHHGEVITYGPTQEVLNTYLAQMNQNDAL